MGGGADVEIDDPEVSRSHCAVEIRHDGTLIRSAFNERNLSAQFSRFGGPIGADVDFSDRNVAAATENYLTMCDLMPWSVNRC
jgi:hypothetical protein